MSHKNLINPITVFCRTYADSTLSEKWAYRDGNSIGEELNKNKINYSAVDEGWNLTIYVEHDDKELVKELSSKSDLTFWSQSLK